MALQKDLFAKPWAIDNGHWTRRQRADHCLLPGYLCRLFHYTSLSNSNQTRLISYRLMFLNESINQLSQPLGLVFRNKGQRIFYALKLHVGNNFAEPFGV